MSDGPLSRRTFVRSTLMLSAGALSPATAAALLRVPERPEGAGTLRVLLAVPPARGGLRDGAVMGAEEARRTAALMSGSVELVVRDRLDVESLADLFTDDAVWAVVGGHDADAARSLARLASRVGAPFVNAGAAEDSLRTELCAMAVYHVAPSAAMLADAERMARQSAGGTARAQGTGGAGRRETRAVAWHASLGRFGAEQLNDRFRARFEGGGGMSSDAWCGWMALKVLGDGMLRSRAASAPELTRWLQSSRPRFDGHKGAALTFRQWDGQLRQPLYVVGADGRVVAELPHVTPGEERSWEDALDELGKGSAAFSCPAGARR